MKKDPNEIDINSTEFKTLLEKKSDELDHHQKALQVLIDKKKFQVEIEKQKREFKRMIIITVIPLGITLITSLLFYAMDSNKEKRLEREQQKEKQIESFTKWLVEFDKSEVKNKKAKAAVIDSLDNTYDDPFITLKIAELKYLTHQIEVKDSALQQMNNIVEKSQNIPKNYSEKTNEDEKAIFNLNAKLQLASNPHERKKIEDSISLLNTKIDASGNVQTKSLVETTGKIEKAVVEKVNLQSTTLSDPTQHAPDVQWFKEGYYLLFKSLKITLLKLNESSGTIAVQICKVQNDPQVCSVVITDSQILSLGSSFDFSAEGKQYRLSLVAIDRAGRNPFTKAAYITLEEV